MPLTALPATLMRGGTSKGLFILSDDLPSDEVSRDRLLLAAMGSPDARQIDGIGGAHPLTSKVAIVSASADDEADIDYLFLQVFVDRAEVSDGQNCGNMLAGVAPFALEHALVEPDGDVTDVRIRMVNTGGFATARVQTPDGVVEYEGDAAIDGVPGTAAPVMLDFLDVAGASCGALLPTGSESDEIDGIDVTCIDNGMPVVLFRADALGKTGYESPAELEGDAVLKERVESLRLQLGERMNLGDVTDKTVPKMCLVSPATRGGVVNTRTFIPHRVHEAIGVLGAASVAAACAIPGTVVDGIATTDGAAMRVEHPTGSFLVEIETDGGVIRRSALLRTARKIMQGQVFVPAN